MNQQEQINSLINIVRELVYATACYAGDLKWTNVDLSVLEKNNILPEKKK